MWVPVDLVGVSYSGKVYWTIRNCLPYSLSGCEKMASIINVHMMPGKKTHTLILVGTVSSFVQGFLYLLL